MAHAKVERGELARTAGDRTPIVHELRIIRGRLLEQARLFEDPDAYTAGVEDALTAVARSLGSSDTITLPEVEPTPRMI